METLPEDIAALEKAAVVHWFPCGEGRMPIRQWENAGAEKADMVIAVTRNDETNMIVCQLASSLFNVSNTDIAFSGKPSFLTRGQITALIGARS